MKSSLKKAAEDECQLEMTSMIDVVFLLLIFFLCTLKFKTLEGKLAAYLPKDVGVNTSEAEEIEKVEIDIWDDLNGNGQRDPGEPGESFSDTLDPPVSHHEMTDISGNLGGSPSNPQYRVEVSTVGAGGIVYSGSIG